MHILTLWLFTAAAAVSSDAAVDFANSLTYLLQYGYLNAEFGELIEMSENSAKYTAALALYQQTYGLPADGKLNNETVQLMGHLRCGVSDNILQHTHRYHWTNKTITWKFYNGFVDDINVTKMAFDLWSKHADIDFIYTPSNPSPNIGLSYGANTHYNYHRRAHCPWSFQRDTIAHAESPNARQNPIEIHLVHGINWNRKIEVPMWDETSLFITLVHEIGHTIGIGHNTINTYSIMYPYYTNSIFNTTPFKLSDDDIAIVQSLYGKRKGTETSPPVDDPPEVEETSTTTTTAAAVATMAYPDLCEISDNINTFLIVNEQLYIFHGKWVWFKKLDDDNYDSKPLALTDWLTFLPKNFTHLSAVYRKPNGQLVFVVQNQVYLVDFSSLSVIQHIVLPHPIVAAQVSAAVNTYTGRSLIFHSDNFVAEIDECTGKIMHNGIVDKTFPGIPRGPEGVFRYTNGKLYFFKGSNFYEFDEFTGKMIRAARFNLNIFSIKCPNVGVLDQIQALLNKIWNYQKKQNK